MRSGVFDDGTGPTLYAGGGFTLLTMRMHMRRFTRLTNGFSKRVANHVHMVAFYTVFYNWTKIHRTLRTTPAWPLA